MLIEHRKLLAANATAYTQDIDRCYGTVVSHLKAAGYKRITRVRTEKDIRRYVDLIFQSQNCKPFFHIEGDLPFCWNAPKFWNLNYVRYEWGHLKSRNQNGDEAYCIENLCLQSARCNQHIQTSMNVEELRHYGGRLQEVIDTNLERRKQLFQSANWHELKNRLEEWR